MSRTIPQGRQSEQVTDMGVGNERLVPLAQDVAIERGVAVAETLFNIAAIRSLHGRAASRLAAKIECVVASAQDRSATHGQQAAHLLPGRITVDGRSVWELARVPSTPRVTPQVLALLEDRTEAGFSRTNVLPAVFNRADSQAERMSGARGLKALFAEAVRWMWLNARVDPLRPLHVDGHTAIHALGIWFKQVNGVYEVAAARKAQASERALQGGSSVAADRELEGRILTVYAESFKVAQPARFVNTHAAFLRTRYAPF